MQFKWIVKPALILTESSYDSGAGADRYRFWDEGHMIPRRGSGVSRAQILIDGYWQEMYFNRVWRQSHDPNGEGCWLKQKASPSFSATTGYETYTVRYVEPEE